MSEILKNISWSQYLDIDALNWSRLKVMARSPAHYHWQLTAPEEDTEAMAVGRAIHAAVLEPIEFDSRFVTWLGSRRQGKEWEKFEAAAHRAGMEVLTQKQSELVRGIRFAARTNPEVSRLLSGGKSEVTVISEVEIPSIGDLPGRKWKTKSRIDYLGRMGTVDLKSTKSAEPDDFARSAWNLGYLGQAAFYFDAVKRATGVEQPFFFLAIEKEAPFVVTPFVVTDDLLQIGREHYQGLLARLALCERENRWPGYVEGITPLHVPKWIERSDQEDVSDIGLTFGGNDDAL